MTKWINRCLIINLIVLCFFILSNYKNSTQDKVVAEESFSFDMVLEEAEQLTQTDILEGVLPEQIEYLDLKNSNYVQLDDFTSYAEEYWVDIIVQPEVKLCLAEIIPIELLFNVGSWYYEGEEYAFYVETVALNDLLSSDVVIVDYNFVFDNETGYIETSVDLFSRTFVTSSSSGNIVNTNRTEVDYLLKDVRFLQEIKNEHELNYGDTGYEKNNDTGAILKASQLSYVGAKKKSDWWQLAQVQLESIRFAIGIADDIPLFAALDTAFSVVETGYNIYKIIEDDYYEISLNDGAILDLYETKETQKSNNSYPTYKRAIQSAPESEYEELFINDYMKLSTVLDSGSTEMRARQAISFNLYTIDEGALFNMFDTAYAYITPNGKIYDRRFVEENVAQSIATKEIVMFEQEEQANEGDNEGYLITKNSEENFYFIPSYNGNYTFSVSENYAIYNINEDEELILVENQELIAYHKYSYVVRAVGEHFNSREYLLNIEFNPESIMLGSNSILLEGNKEEYLKIDIKQKVYCEIISSNSVEFKLYDENMTIIKLSYDKIDFVIDNSTYIIEIVSTESTQAVITCNIINYIQFVIYNGENLPDLKIVNNQTIALPIPNLNPGYNFEGWWDNPNYEGNEITEDNINYFDEPDIVLYSKEVPIEYSISYHENGAEDIEDASYTIESGAVLNNNIIKENYTFLGWYETADFSSEKVEIIPTGTIGDKNYYAKWVVTLHNITFDVGSGYYSNASMNNTFVVVAYGNSYVLPTPTLNGYTFEGWLYNGNLVTSALGEITFFIEEENVTFVAKWSAINFYVKITVDDFTSVVRYLTADGLTSSEEVVSLDDFIVEGIVAHTCPNCWAMQNKQVFFKEGYVFDGLYYGNELACWNNIEIPNITEECEIELEAQYVVETYIVDFYNCAEQEMPSVIVAYNEEIPLPTIYGYNCVYKLADYEKNYSFVNIYPIGYEFSEYELIKDLTPMEENGNVGITIYIEVLKTAKQTHLILIDEITGTEYNSTATFDEELSNIPILERFGYCFMGWFFRAEDGTEILYINSDSEYVSAENGSTWDIDEYNLILYAGWIGEMHTITLEANGGYGGSTEVDVRYGDPMPFIIAPQKTGYIFSGYYTMNNGRGVKYYNGPNPSSVKNWDVDDDMILFAYWTPCTYNIIYGNLLPGVTASVYSFVYDQGLSTMPSLYMQYNGVMTEINVHGWYSDENLEFSKTRIPAYTYGAVTLYAKYDYLITNSISSNLSLTITDGNLMNQPYCNVNISALKNSYSTYTQNGFNNVLIKISVEYDEEQDGYQEFYIYNGTLQLWGGEAEFDTHIEENLTYNNDIVIGIQNFEGSTYLTLRFGAHGTFRDNWTIKTIAVEVYVIN